MLCLDPMDMGKRARARAARCSFTLSCLAALAACAAPDGAREPRAGTLAAAIQAGEVSTIEQMVAAGARLDLPADGELPLQQAARLGSLPALEALLELGARPAWRAADGRTALHSAALAGQVGAARALLAARARLDLSDRDGNQPLHLSSTKAMDEVLIAAGAELGALGARERSALEVLRSRGREASERMLRELSQGRFDAIADHLARGADPNAHDSSRRSALSLLLLSRGEVSLRVVSKGVETQERLSADQLSGKAAIEVHAGRVAGIAWEPGPRAEQGLTALRELVRAGADTQRSVEATGLWMLFPGIAADMSQFESSGVVRMNLIQFARAIGETDALELLRRGS